MSARYIWISAIAVDADTVDAATEIIENVWAGDQWEEVAPSVQVWTPAGPPDEAEEPDAGPACNCPPRAIVDRGGVRGSCPVHGVYRLSWP